MMFSICNHNAYVVLYEGRHSFVYSLFIWVTYIPIGTQAYPNAVSLAVLRWAMGDVV